MAEAGADQANLSAIDRINAVTREAYAGLTLLDIVMAVKNRRKKPPSGPNRRLSDSGSVIAGIKCSIVRIKVD